MARPHIKYLNSKDLEWRAARDKGFLYKPLSQDSDTHAMTALISVPADFRGTGLRDGDATEEVYVISGDLAFGDDIYGAGEYCYRPSGLSTTTEIASTDGCIAFLKLSPPVANDRPAVEHLHVDRADWRASGEGPNASRRIVLSQHPETGANTVLLELPAGWRGRAGAHYHSRSEEVFVLSGDVALDDTPIYTEGCYIFRPGGIMHGPKERSESGCRLFIIAEEGPLDFNYARDMADPQSVPWE